jgi:hypothetical protein
LHSIKTRGIPFTKITISGKIGCFKPSSWNWLVTRKSLFSGLSKSKSLTVFSTFPSPKFWATVMGSNPPDLDNITIDSENISNLLLLSTKRLWWWSRQIMVFSVIQIEVDYVLHRVAECTLLINMSKRINKVV